MIKRVKNKFFEEIIFSISFVMAIITSFFAVPKFSYIDWRVMAALFNLMIVLLAFEKLFLLDSASVYILSKFKSKRMVSLVLILITFFSSMLVTNDVALITFVPITLIISKKAGFDPLFIVILQTLAANIGSSLTPMGNPQNLYLYTFYNINTLEFLKIMFPFVFLGLFFLLLINQINPKTVLEFSLDKVETGKAYKIAIYTVLFILILLSVFRSIDYRIAFIITVVVIILLDRELIKKVDYFLLGTFICFFIVIGNISAISEITVVLKNFLDNSVGVYLSSIIFSQIISNVPCAILLSGFTGYWKEVLLGVNVGGVGTLVASMASLISYKIYACEYPGKRFLKWFHIYNAILLIIFTVAVYVMVKWLKIV